MTDVLSDDLADARARITELEIRLTFQDDVIAALDEVVRELARRAERAEVALTELQARLGALDGGGGPEVGPHDEEPPHY